MLKYLENTTGRPENKLEDDEVRFYLHRAYEIEEAVNERIRAIGAEGIIESGVRLQGLLNGYNFVITLCNIRKGVEYYLNFPLDATNEEAVESFNECVLLKDLSPEGCEAAALYEIETHTQMLEIEAYILSKIEMYTQLALESEASINRRLEMYGKGNAAVEEANLIS